MLAFSLIAKPNVMFQQVYTLVLLELPGLLFFSTYTLLVLFWAEIYHQVLIIYSLRSIILFANMDVSRHILVVDTSVFAKSNMGRREYYLCSSVSKT
jgi:hypothetical protein